MKMYKFMGLSAMVMLLAFTALVLSGCARKHIVSSPPAQRPAQGVTPAPAPTVVEEKPGLIEDTYVVDAPAEEAARTSRVQEGDLADEPTPAPAKTVRNDPAPAREAEAVPMGEMYYIQVGAFSDVENANKVLARLIGDGYTGSKLAKTDDGLFRVQAGAFPDREAAEDAFLRLEPEFPKGFILKF